MAPALRIPVSLDLNSLKDQTKQASDRVGETLKVVGQAFKQVNGEMLGIASATASGVALGWAQSAAGMALRFSLLAGAGIGAFKLLGAAIDVTREQLTKMVEIADKSRDATVSPAFFQSFLTEANKLKVSADDLEGALTHAFGATKEVSPIDLGKWEAGEDKITDVEKALRVYNETLAKTAGTQLQGLVLFRDAQNQEQKVAAVLQAMVQLNDIGQKLAALDLGEKMFGAQFVERIRQGRTSAEAMLDTIKSASSASAGFFPNELVLRAKEIDDQLKKAEQTLSREMKPTWESLANTMLTIKSLWADVIDIMAKGAALANKIGLVTSSAAELSKSRAELQSLQDQGPGSKVSFLGFDVGTLSNDAPRQARIKFLQDKIADLSLKSGELEFNDAFGGSRSKGAGAAPTLKKDDTKDSRDRFDSASDNVEKRAASLQAETANIDLNTQARERARVVAELETVAKQANAAAGKENTEVTAEQRDRINEVADAYGKAALAIEKARSPLQTWVRESQNVDKALNQFAANGLENLADSMVAVASRTKTISEAFRAMATSILQDLARIAARRAISGLFSSILGVAGGGGKGFGETNFDLGDWSHIDGNAAGTDDWRGGPTWVGEQGPEILNLPKGSQIIPNNVATRGGGGSPTFVYAPSNNFKGTSEELAQMRRIQDEDRARFPQVVAAHIANPNSAISKSLKNNTTTQTRR